MQRLYFVVETKSSLFADDLRDKEWGKMVAMQGTDIKRVDFSEALDGLKTVPAYRYEEAKVLFGR